MKYIFNFPGMSQRAMAELVDKMNCRGKTFEEIVAVFFDVEAFQIIDLEKGIMYSYDGKHIEIRDCH